MGSLFGSGGVFGGGVGDDEVDGGRGHGEDGEEGDGDGDLGINAVGYRHEGRRKVIVERLEVLQTKGPFFTWC